MPQFYHHQSEKKLFLHALVNGYGAGNSAKKKIAFCAVAAGKRRWAREAVLPAPREAPRESAAMVGSEGEH